MAKRITDSRQISDPPSQGAESNLSGKFLERNIEQEFQTRGVIAYPFSTRVYNGNLFDDRYLIKRVPYRSIYGGISRSEFVYYHFSANIRIRIECRWQQTRGSIDEKMPYLIMNARDAMPEPEVWLVIDGDGARTNSLQWISEAASAATAGKTIRVLNLSAARKEIKLLLNGRLRPIQQTYQAKKGGMDRRILPKSAPVDFGPLFKKG